MDAWAPVFFFAMVFAISMDYTVFLLAPPGSTGTGRTTRVRPWSAASPTRGA